MAEILTAGEVIRFAELAWTLYETGWSEERRAGKAAPNLSPPFRSINDLVRTLLTTTDDQYRRFGQDVRYLAQSLERLESVINNARDQFHNHGQELPNAFGWDQASLVEIIGDYSETLDDCFRLLEENHSYNSTTTGPGKNIYWNVFVQPRVEVLRRRILLHNSKIEHVLRPFQIDLTLRIHDALARRLEALHRDLSQQIQLLHLDVQGISRDLQELMVAFDPARVQAPDDDPEEGEIHQLPMPEGVEMHLESLYWRHPGRLDEDYFFVPPLRDVADAFLRLFDFSAEPFQAEGVEGGNPEDQYLNLLTCQFLMKKMLESEEYLRSHEQSHWPSYVQSLQKQLSNRCLRFVEDVGIPQSPSPQTLLLPPIWLEEDLPDYNDPVEKPTPMELLLDIELATESKRRWQRVAVYRLSDSQDRRFRLVITRGDVGQSSLSSAAATTPKTVKIDLDLDVGSVMPQYALPDGSQPWMLIVDDGRHTMQRLTFRTREDLFLFQQALTGYEVVDNYVR